MTVIIFVISNNDCNDNKLYLWRGTPDSTRNTD